MYWGDLKLGGLTPSETRGRMFLVFWRRQAQKERPGKRLGVKSSDAQKTTFGELLSSSPNLLVSDRPQLASSWRSRWHPTPVLLPGTQGWGSLVGCCLWGRTESVGHD